MDTTAKPRHHQHQQSHHQHQQHQQLQTPPLAQPTTRPKQTICRACKQKLQLASDKVRRTVLARQPASPPTTPPPPPPPPVTATAKKAAACATVAMASMSTGTTIPTFVASPVASPRTSTVGSSHSRTSSHSIHSTRSSSDRCDPRVGCGNGADYGAADWGQQQEQQQQQQQHQGWSTSFTDEVQTCYNLLLMIRADTQILIALRNENLAELERVASPAVDSVQSGATDDGLEDENSTRTNSSNIDRALLLAAINEAITYATKSIAELGPFLEKHRWPGSPPYSPGAGEGPGGGSPTNPSESSSSRIKILRGRRPKSFFPRASSTYSSAASTCSSTVPTSKPQTSHSRVTSSYAQPQAEIGPRDTGPLSAEALFSWTVALTDLHSAVLAATAQLRGFVEFGIGAVGVSDEYRRKHAARTSWWEQDRGEFENVDLIQSLLGPRRPRRETWGGGRGGSSKKTTTTAAAGDGFEIEKQRTVAVAGEATALEGDSTAMENGPGEAKQYKTSSSLPDNHIATRDKGKARERDDSAMASLTPVLEGDDSRSETWASPLSAPSTRKSTIGDGSDYGLTPRPRTERQGSLQHDSPFAVRRSATDPVLSFSSSPLKEAPVQMVQVARSETFGQGGGRGGGGGGGGGGEGAVGREALEQQQPLPLSRFHRPDCSKNPRRRPTISTTMISTTTPVMQQHHQQQSTQYAPLPALNVLQEQLSQALSGIELGLDPGLGSINDGGSSPLSSGIPHLLTTDNSNNNSTTTTTTTTTTTKPPAARRISSSPILLSAPLLPNRSRTNPNLHPSPTRRTTEPLLSMATTTTTTTTSTTTRPASSHSPATATPATPLDPHLLALIVQRALPSKTFQPVIAALDDMIDVAPPVSPMSSLENESDKLLPSLAGQHAAVTPTTALTPTNNDKAAITGVSPALNSHHRSTPSLNLLRVQPLRPQHQLIQRVSIHPVIEDGGEPPTPDYDDHDRRQSRGSSIVPSPQVLVTPAPEPGPAPASPPCTGTEQQGYPPQPQSQHLSRAQTQNQPKAYIPFVHHNREQHRPWSPGAAGRPPTGRNTGTDSTEYQPFLAYMARKQAVSAARWTLDKAQSLLDVPQQQRQ